MTHPKQTCAVFGCKRWSRKFPPDWSFLCADHYRSVPPKLRKLHQRRMREARLQTVADLSRRMGDVDRTEGQQAAETYLGKYPRPHPDRGGVSGAAVLFLGMIAVFGFIVAIAVVVT